MSSAAISLRALFGRIGVAVVLCLVLTAGAVFAVNRYIDDEIDRIPRVALTTSTTSNNGTNFLIVGSDSREFVASEGEQNSFGTAGDAGPPKSDTMMVLHANGDRSFAVSFPRDTWVNIPGRGEMKLNAAFNDGPQALIDTLQQTFQVGINHYLEVDFRSFKGLVDAIGTVPVYSEYATVDVETGLEMPFPNACYHLDGGQALAYVRSRHPQYFIDGAFRDGSGRADLDRIERQQAFVKTLGRVAVQRAIDDPTIAPDIADQVIPNLHADAGFDRPAFNELARAFVGLSSGDGSSVEFATLPTEQGRRSSQDVLLVDESKAPDMLARLRGDVVVDPVPPATSEGDAPVALQPSDVRVTVLNGSNVNGAAGDASQELANLGFIGGEIGNDSRGTVQGTEVLYRDADAAKAQLVASYVEGAVLKVDNSVGGDVVLVVGKNFTRIAKVAAPSGDTPAPTAPPSPEASCV